MIGLDRTSAAPLSGDAHLSQSIADILFTPIGSRVMRRSYGSDLPALLDAPVNGATVVDLYAAVAEALDQWEPRIRLTRVALVEASAEGRAGFALAFERRDGAGGNVTVEVPA